ncbi:MAG: tRNA 5-methoxyuridine(34)/uridine 5-oxyacetic acid(34) synthase CmoB [Fuerstiella sp.]
MDDAAEPDSSADVAAAIVSSLPFGDDLHRSLEIIREASSADQHLRRCDQLHRQCVSAFDPLQNGNLTRWLDAWHDLPQVPDCKWTVDDGRVIIQSPEAPATTNDLHEQLMAFHPWRKGPLQIFDQPIDTEWRSDWKWDRLGDAVEFRSRRVLDVGCGNGYFGWRMLKAGAQSVCGIDPFLLFVMQHQVFRKYVAEPANFVLPLTDDDLHGLSPAFEVVLSMGVLYHRISPIEHLQTLFQLLQPGGQVVVETLILDQRDQSVLVPSGRYAKMRNVWFLPTPSMLAVWLRRLGFRQIKVVDVTATTVSEQRSTDYMSFESLPDFLDPTDSTKTIEGYQAPVRAIVTARK